MAALRTAPIQLSAYRIPNRVLLAMSLFLMAEFQVITGRAYPQLSRSSRHTREVSRQLDRTQKRNERCPFCCYGRIAHTSFTGRLSTCRPPLRQSFGCIALMLPLQLLRDSFLRWT